MFSQSMGALAYKDFIQKQFSLHASFFNISSLSNLISIPLPGMRYHPQVNVTNALQQAQRNVM